VRDTIFDIQLPQDFMTGCQRIDEDLFTQVQQAGITINKDCFVSPPELWSIGFMTTGLALLPTTHMPPSPAQISLRCFE
jgi:hypothetical protein